MLNNSIKRNKSELSLVHFGLVLGVKSRYGVFGPQIRIIAPRAQVRALHNKQLTSLKNHNFTWLTTFYSVSNAISVPFNKNFTEEAGEKDQLSLSIED